MHWFFFQVKTHSLFYLYCYLILLVTKTEERLVWFTSRCHSFIKGAPWSFGDILIRSESSSQSLHFHDSINTLTLNNNTILHCLTLSTCGGPCHLSSFNQYSGDLIFLWEQLVYSVMGKNCCISSPKLHSAPLTIVQAKFCYNIFSMEYIIQPITTEHCSIHDIQNKIGYLQRKCRWATF